VLGPLVVLDDDRTVPLGGRRERAVCAALVLNAGRPVPVDTLAAAVWGEEPPRTAGHTLKNYVLRLRHALDADLVIETVPGGYSLRAAPDAVDASVVERLAESARALAATDPARALDLIRTALGRFRGPAYADIADFPAARVEAERFRELADCLREEEVAVALASRPPAGVLPGARALVEAEPLRERRWELLMLTLYRSGRQADALDAYASARALLADELGIDPGPALRRLQQRILAQDPTLEVNEPPGSGQRATLPGVATRRVGRDSEAAALADALSRSRLVTVIGPAGAGKSRLAIEHARQVGGQVWWVPLEGLTGTPVAAAVLDAVASPSRARDARGGLLDALAEESGLLVLDGCEERRAETATDVAAVLGRCPGVRVLATSRERLGLLDEALVPLGPLPDDDALELLTDRARLVRADFAIDDESRAAAVRLCHLLDGLPLGVELVAPHLRLLSMAELAVRVDADLQRWTAGVPTGRDTLWVAINRSVGRLPVAERRLLCRLGVLVADADLDLVAAVGAPGEPVEDVFDRVAALVDRSLLDVRPGAGDGGVRYQQLETVRRYALSELAADERAAAEAAYAGAVLERTEELAARISGADRADVLATLDRELPHVRAALRHTMSAAGDAPAGLRVATALADYWLGRRPQEGLEWLQDLLAAAPARPRARADALLRMGHLAYWITDFQLGKRLVADALSEYDGLGDALGAGRALRRLGAIAAAADDVVAARSYFEQSLSRLEVAGSEPDIGTTLLHLGSLLADESLVVESGPMLRRALAIAQRGTDPLAEGHALAALTLSLWRAGDLDEAAAVGKRALSAFSSLGHRPTEGTVAYRLAAVSRGLGRPAEARRYAQVALAAGRLSGTRTTTALANVNLARLDLDAGDPRAASANISAALAELEPTADRWVLVECLEALARLLAERGDPRAGDIAATAATIRRAIRQPVAPTEAADVAALPLGHSAGTDPVAAYRIAVDAAAGATTRISEETVVALESRRRSQRNRRR